MTCGVTPNALWHRCSHVESRRAKCSNAPAVRAESGLGETTTWSAPYANWYANQPDSGGVRGCTPTYVKRSDLQELDTHEHRRTHCLNLGVKWSQVQILSARPLKWPLSCENGRVAHHRRQCVEGSIVRLPMSSTCRLIRSCPNGRAHSVGIGVVSVVALIHVLVEVIAITNGASPSGAPCGVVRTVPLREQWQPTSCRRREPESTPFDAAPDRWPLVGVDRPPGKHGVDRRPDVSGRHR